MKIISKDIKKGFVKIQVQNLDDLWYLSQIIDQGDLIKGTTFRKIRIGDKDDRNTNVVRKKVFLEIRAEKIEFHKYSDILRVSGKITQGPEDVQAGTHHTFNVDEDTIISVQKQRFLKYQIEKLNDAAKENRLKVMICVFDRESAIFALVKNYGFDILSEIKGDVQKKDNPGQTRATGSFYKEIVSQLKSYDTKYCLNRIVVASPGFWKEYLLDAFGKDEIAKKIISASCNSVGESAINEVLRRPEIHSALAEDRIIKEANTVEELMAEISRDGCAAYGLSMTENAISIGAVKMLLVTDSLIRKMREQESYARLETMMKTADSMDAEIHIISSEHEAGKKLEGLGGIGAILRYKAQ
ncbi:mRNA surveillance protein pelota [Candidatus Woesearchaeota archaeon]|nr:mRNA surveillance protein pelota [Candidatus Woesearchaeota archaeon]